MAVATSACSPPDDTSPDQAGSSSDLTAESTPAGGEPVGPLCALLPGGTDPGAPVFLRDVSADVALEWIPVLTIFEAGARATGLATEFGEADAITILAPTDDAFQAAFTQDTLDELLVSRHDELRALLEAHLLDGAVSLSDLRQAGSVGTRAGDTLVVAPADSMARFDDRAESVCADYQVANGRIHVIDGVLGELPEPAPRTDPGDG